MAKRKALTGSAVKGLNVVCFICFVRQLLVHLRILCCPVFLTNKHDHNDVIAALFSYTWLPAYLSHTTDSKSAADCTVILSRTMWFTFYHFVKSKTSLFAYYNVQQLFHVVNRTYKRYNKLSLRVSRTCF